jgi:acyl carrier protein
VSLSENFERANRDAIERQLRLIWADLLDVPVSAITDQSSFSELGGNSMSFLSLQIALKTVFDLEPSTSMLMEFSTFSDLLCWTVVQYACA